jgi:PIN domain nuclease of toxin-antitoxin system
MILLDTHALVWSTTSPVQLSTAARRAILAARAGDGVALAAVSLHELAIVVIRSGLRGPADPVEQTLLRLTEGVAILPLTPAIAALAVQFSRDALPGDPGDRLMSRRRWRMVWSW